VLATCVPILFGTNRLHMKLLQTTDFTSKKDTSQGGKGFGAGKGTVWDYYCALAGLLCQGPVQGLRSVWDQSGALQAQGATENFTVPPGGGTYAVQNSGFSMDHGVSATAPYSQPHNDFGAPGPGVAAGTQQTPLQLVQGTPEAGQYSTDGKGNYTFAAGDSGKSVQINYTYSLFYSVTTEACQIPFSAPYSYDPQNQQYFHQAVSCVYVNSGQPLTRINSDDGSPTQGQYMVSGGTDSGGTYFFSAADAGQEVYITYQFTSSTAEYTPSSHLNLTLFNGGSGQQPWSYMETNHAAEALAYPTEAYVASSQMSLGTSNVLPNYNIEVVGLLPFGGGIIDAEVTACINEMLTNPYWGVGYPVAALGDWTQAKNFLVANSFFISQILNSQEAAASVIENWLKAGNVGAFCSEGLLKLAPYGDITAVGNGATFTPNTNPVYNFGLNDFVVDSDSDSPVQMSRSSARDAYNYVQVQWADRLNSYNNNLVSDQDDAAILLYGLRPESPQTYDFLTTQTAATFAAQARRLRNVYIRSKYTWKTDARKSFIEPMDVVTLSDGAALNYLPVRVIETEESEDGSEITFTAEDFPYAVATPVQYGRQAATLGSVNASQADPGATTPYVFETTIQEMNGATNCLKVAASGSSPNWGGCRVWASMDGQNYTPVGVIQGQSKLGILTAPLPTASANPDTTSILSVDMTLSGGALTSVTQAEADSFASLCAILTGTAVELLSYETATPTGTNKFNLNYLRRGVYSSAVAAHNAGDRFVWLDENVVSLEYRAQYVGQKVYLKFTSFNLYQGREQQLSDVPGMPYSITGTTLGPPSPGSFVTNPGNVLSAGVTTITVSPFTASVGSTVANCLPGGAYTISGLLPVTTYFVYYFDPAFQGGNITPIATSNNADYSNKTGYFYLGSIQTT
jgi:hypothetical protein